MGGGGGEAGEVSERGLDVGCGERGWGCVHLMAVLPVFVFDR